MSLPENVNNLNGIETKHDTCSCAEAERLQHGRGAHDWGDVKLDWNTHPPAEGLRAYNDKHVPEQVARGVVQDAQSPRCLSHCLPIHTHTHV